MLFAFPIGILLLLREKKAAQKYQAVFDNFYDKVKADERLTPEEKLDLYVEMLQQNRYQVTLKNAQEIQGEKKIFSIGYMFIGIGTLYIGLIIYILYYLYMQKPHTVRFQISQ